MAESRILNSGFLHTSFVDFDFTVAKITHNFTTRLSSPTSTRLLLSQLKESQPDRQQRITVLEGVAVACASGVIVSAETSACFLSQAPLATLPACSDDASSPSQRSYKQSDTTLQSTQTHVHESLPAESTTTDLHRSEEHTSELQSRI